MHKSRFQFAKEHEYARSNILLSIFLEIYFGDLNTSQHIHGLHNIQTSKIPGLTDN